MATLTDAEAAARLVDAKVLVELGWMIEAELEVAEVLDERPGDLTALSLFAKIKHIRGELSQAIACWAQLHARSPHNETALMHLGSLLHLAQDPERGAGEFLALGQYQLLRKPRGQLELEEAFALFHERKPAEARARCAELAARYLGKDLQMHKLAVLASAWIAEMTGDLVGAAELLEQLGLQRGYELDLDRLLGLARIYERIGGDDRLRAGVKILRHLDTELDRRGVEKISLHGRLAALYGRLGDPEQAARYRRQYVDGLRRRMHRPTRAEVVTVAARRYLPLSELRTLAPLPSELAADATPRQRALADVLAGRDDAARAVLAAGKEPLDRKYVADLAAVDEAVPLYLAAHEADPGDVRIAGWLLDHHDRTPTPAIAARFARPEAAQAARSQLEHAIQVEPRRPAPWRQLAVLHAITGDSHAAARCRDRAVALADADRARVAPIGRVLAAGVYHFVGKAKGLIHEVWVHREPAAPGKGGNLPVDAILGNLTDEMKLGVRNTFIAVREYARTHFPHRTADLADHSYSYKLPKEDEPSGGLSAGLPSALAFLSVFLQRPVPQTVASSGTVVTEAHDVLSIGRIGDAEYKVKAAFHRNLETLLLPLANRSELEQSLVAPPELAQDLVRYVARFDQALRLVWGDDVFVDAD